MSNSLFTACLPWLAVLLVAVFAARLLVWLSRARLNLRRVPQLHRCEQGSVQSLSFVLTLPFFLMILMLIVQVSQIMVANIAVHYAAHASARSAVVWIPANISLDETANRISSFNVIERTSEGTKYLFASDPGSPKYAKIHQAAAIACAPMAPSRSLGYEMDANGQFIGFALNRVYAGLDAESQNNTLISTRINNKLAWSLANTDVQIEFWHRVGPFINYQDPPLQVRYDVPPYRDEFYRNEVGWQDEITTTVTHNLALLPGPLRLISRNVSIDRSGETYIFPISAAATMVVEGEKPLLSYWQEELR